MLYCDRAMLDEVPHLPDGMPLPRRLPWPVVVLLLGTLMGTLGAWATWITVSVWGLVGRCDGIHARLDHHDADLAELQRWRENCGRKQAEHTEYTRRDDARMAELGRRVDRVEDRIDAKHPAGR